MIFQADQSGAPNRSSSESEDEGHDRLRHLREDSFSGSESEDACMFAETQNDFFDESSSDSESESDEETKRLASSHEQSSKEKVSDMHTL